MDLQFAAMPDIARDMNASVAAAQGTLSAFAGVFGVLQLAYGPVSDRLGRKPLVVGGMILFGLASIGAVLAALLSWNVNHSVLWALVHAFLSWFYVIYHWIVYGKVLP